MTEVRAPYAGRTVPTAAACAHCAERDLRDEVSQLRVQVAELDRFNNELLAKLARLSAGIAGLRREHEPVQSWCDEEEPCGGESGGYCACGADEHNAKVDALLAGAP